MSFIVRELNDNDPFGTKLNQMRRRLAISLDMAAEATRVQRRYLEALEKGDFSALPEAIYTRNFIKTYVKYLGGDVGYFLKCYEEECGTCQVVNSSLRLPRQRLAWLEIYTPHRLIKIGFALLLIVVVGIYLAWQISAIVRPPEIILFEPLDSIVTSEAKILVSGQINQEAEVWINQEKILPNQSGVFSNEVFLERGLNIITIEAAKRYSKTQTLYRTVVFESQE